MDETSVLRRVWLRMQHISTLFRVHTGKAWVVGGGGPPRHIVHGGERGIFIPGGRPIALGLSLVTGQPVEGTSDLVGFTPIEVTAAMVGHRLPVFTTFETKATGEAKGHTRTAEAQRHFVGVVKTAGGISAIVDDPDGAVAAYQEFLQRFDI